MAKALNQVDTGGVSLPEVRGKKGLGLAGTVLGLTLTGLATKVETAYGSEPAPTFETASNVTGASTVGINEAWPTAIDPDPSNGTSSDVNLVFAESDMVSYADPMYLEGGATAATDISLPTSLAAWGCQFEDTVTMSCLDESTNPQEFTDISGSGDWSSVDETASTAFYGSAGEFAYDQLSGERAITVNSGDYGIEYTDGSVLVDDSSEDETKPIIDATRNRAFYRKNESEIWMIDLTDGSEQHVSALDDCHYLALEPNNLLWYCAELNGFGDYDINVRRETTYDTATDPDTDGDGDLDSVDCDDTDATINSSATEVCDGVDNNCDESTDGTDSADVSTWYRDADEDGYGDATSTVEACDVPAGYVADSTDYDDGNASVHEEPVVDTGDSGDTGTVSPVCLTESPAGPYEAPDSICLGTGALIGVDQQDVIYDGSQTTTLDEMFDGVTFEASDGESFTLDSLDVNGWTFEPDFVGSGGESVVGGYILGVSGFAEGTGTAILTLTSGQMIATDASGHSEPVTVGEWSIPDERVVDDTGGEGDADTDVDSDTDTDSGTEDTDTDSGTEDTDTDSGTEDTDTDEEKKIKPAEPVEDTAICATVSVKTGWIMALTAAAAALLRRRKQA